MADDKDVLYPLTFAFPLSGPVPITQLIAPWTQVVGPCGNQLGLINVKIGSSKDAALERRIVETTGSYGKQIGRIGEALAVLIDHLDGTGALAGLEEPGRRALGDLRKMIAAIGEVKEVHGRSARSPAG